MEAQETMGKPVALASMRACARGALRAEQGPQGEHYPLRDDAAGPYGARRAMDALQITYPELEWISGRRRLGDPSERWGWAAATDAVAAMALYGWGPGAFFRHGTLPMGPVLDRSRFGDTCLIVAQACHGDAAAMDELGKRAASIYAESIRLAQRLATELIEGCDPAGASECLWHIDSKSTYTLFSEGTGVIPF